MLKDTLASAPILKYPDTSKPYTIFTDASKYGWARVLMQEHTSMLNGKEMTTKHPVVYVVVSKFSAVRPVILVDSFSSYA